MLLERLRNEITRVTTVRTFQQLATARMDMQLGPVLQPVVAELCAFLRKASRPLRQTSLQALDTIVLNHGAKLGAADIAAVYNGGAGLDLMAPPPVPQPRVTPCSADGAASR